MVYIPNLDKWTILSILAVFLWIGIGILIGHAINVSSTIKECNDFIFKEYINTTGATWKKGLVSGFELKYTISSDLNSSNYT